MNPKGPEALAVVCELQASHATWDGVLSNLATVETDVAHDGVLAQLSGDSAPVISNVLTRVIFD